ncbi:VCBS repeat-containing protein [Chitinophagaceae bacterium LB-8]|uniref:VCBS repeat-containing protein n=1 Tax=Paraflavisolibacter caeni TaxID=2982496 RepID=A0A9X2XSY3_9BACT|nr:VCBS repeat-containing protein [Paraflavisolibacter caeni]MCU7547915.1 VCBS repeat-containing protein [Paraflavisolibacter caeni]
MFEQIDSSHSGIHFNNQIEDDDTLNILNVENIYNGGGVGIADFNNDGLQDIYFTANMVSNKLYLNKGDFQFEDITDDAGVGGDGRWCRGVSIVDINNDGLMDLYVSASLLSNPKKRENLLYINEGMNAKGIPHFINRAVEYGLADTSHSTMAAFFDYDNDGDLDMYLLVNEIVKDQYPNTFRPILKNSEHPNTDKLFRNDWDNHLKHPVFTDVSKEAGITVEGYGHGVNITDINKDGWKDIYVTNDFLSNNNLFINNGNGSFTDQAATYFKHTSENSMGQDVMDINNDGLADVIEADMNPEDNFRKKMMLNPLGYQRYQNNEYYGYQYQYVRNVVQLNQGPRLGQNDSVGVPIFSDIAFSSGVAETDWSWAPVVADFDNDGFRDIIITNGFPKDVTDHDFITFRNKAWLLASKKEILEQIPQVKIANYAFKNNGDLTFKNVTKAWGLATPTFANGAAYADLDNDGDLDFVVNNINDEASIYKNKEREHNHEKNHYLRIHLEGDTMNINGFGTWVELYYQGKQQVYEQTPYRGYLSSIQQDPQFGLGAVASIDSVVIKWPNGKMQLLQNIKADQLLKVNIKNATQHYSFTHETVAQNAIFREVTGERNIQYVHQDSDFVDFNIQKLLPHKFTEYGPALAVGDVDGNGLEDVISGGSFYYGEQVFLQQLDGRFVQRNLQEKKTNKGAEDMGILLFDADGDHDLDLYVASGGYEAPANSIAYRDRLYVNDGKGNFTPDTTALPQNLTSKSCVRAADYDNDGDLDLFIAGRIDPWNYPKPVSSFIYRNDSQNGVIKFSDVTASIAKPLLNIGLICDALFTDYDHDGWQDLLLAGEWKPITLLRNEKGRFTNIHLPISNLFGWWNTIAPGDFDNDGDVDYIVGNLGKNSFYRASEKYPVCITAKDFDNNGSYDAFPSLFLPVSQNDTTRKEFPAHLRDEVIKQMISLRTKFQNYHSFAIAPMDEMLTEEQRKDALRLQANYLQSAYMRNDGNGKFILLPLPMQAQISVLNGMVAEDFDGDGNLDLVINGNDYGAEVSVGRYDALNGLYLKGDGKGNFSSLSILNSGIFIPGNGKALVKLRSQSGDCLLVASQNKGPLKIFQLKKRVQCIPLQPSDVSFLIRYKDGRIQRGEVYYGSSFLSQSGRFLIINNKVTSVEVMDGKGRKRIISGTLAS